MDIIDSDVPGSNPGDTVATYQGPQTDVAELVSCFADYEKAFEKWKKRSDRIIKRYRDENRDINAGGSSVRFNILWSNVQTLVPAVFAKLPFADVCRRFRDNDPVARVAALILERALDYEINQYPDYSATMTESVLDRFLGGRGTAWVRYEPHFRAAQSQQPTDGVEVSEDIDTPGEELDYECSPVDYVHWQDFGHSVARTWAEVSRVWRIVYMDKEAVTERFGKEWADKIPYDSGPKIDQTFMGMGLSSYHDKHTQAKIYEVWDKQKKTALWFSHSLKEIVQELPDPLGLEDFFPCPKPLFATLTNETLVPIPDFALYQDQAIELDILSDRIDGLIKALQVKGCYDASIPELARLFSEAGNTDMVPVKNFASFAEKSGLKGSIDLVDLEPIYNAMTAAFDALERCKQIIYEITGISDIVRGQTQASETLGAQQIKQNFVGLRLGKMQTDVARYAAEILCIKAQVICGKYSPETIATISASDELSDADKPLIPQALALLVGPARMMDPQADSGPNPTRRFRIDIESDSLVKLDEQQEKQDRLEFLTDVGSFLEKSFPLAQENPTAAPLIMQMLLFGIRGFKVGRTIEGEFEQAVDQLRQLAMQPKPPKPDPELIRVQSQANIDQQRLAADQQNKQSEMQMDQFRYMAEQRAKQNEMQVDAMLKRFESEIKAQTAAQQLQFDRWKTEYMGGIQLAVAELSAKTQVKTASMSANDGGDPMNSGEFNDQGESVPKSSLMQLVNTINERTIALGDLSAKVDDLHQQVNRPKKIVRDMDPNSPTYLRIMGAA